MDMRPQAVDTALAEFYDSLFAEDGEPEREPDPFMEELVRGTVGRMEEIDRRIGEHSEHWRLERMPGVDQNILRLAVCELMLIETPPAVVIDEALELARRFAGDDSIAFINGVLESIRRGL